MDKRLEHEIEHGKFLAEHGAGEIWNWESPAGRVRWQRRVQILTGMVKSTSKVLEIGCGTGYFTKELAKTGAEIMATDISPELLVIARNEVNSPNVSFLQDNAYAMQFPDETFDFVIGSSILHHLEIENAIGEMFRVLRKGGYIVFTEPNMVNPQIALQKNIPALKRRLGDSPDETAFFRWKLRRQLRKGGFVNMKIKPFDFLHPAVPSFMIKTIDGFGKFIEKVPILKEIAGSLIITAEKP